MGLAAEFSSCKTASTVWLILHLGLFISFTSTDDAFLNILLPARDYKSQLQIEARGYAEQCIS